MIEGGTLDMGGPGWTELQMLEFCFNFAIECSVMLILSSASIKLHLLKYNL